MTLQRLPNMSIHRWDVALLLLHITVLQAAGGGKLTCPRKSLILLHMHFYVVSVKQSFEWSGIDVETHRRCVGGHADDVWDFGASGGGGSVSGCSSLACWSNVSSPFSFTAFCINSVSTPNCHSF